MTKKRTRGLKITTDQFIGPDSDRSTLVIKRWRSGADVADYSIRIEMDFWIADEIAKHCLRYLKNERDSLNARLTDLKELTQ